MSEIVKINPEMGQKLLERAEAKARHELIEAAVEQTSRIVKDRENALLWERQNAHAAEFYQQQLDAISKGEFTTGRNRVLKFIDERLNKSVQEIIGEV